MARFWVYVGDKVLGPVDIPSLRKVPGFNLLTQVCQEGEETWRIADEVIEIKSYFLSPPRPNSFAIEMGNAAPRLDLALPRPELEEMTLPEPNTSWQKLATPSKQGEPILEILPADEPKTEPAAAGPGAALRAVCEVCGYKNPRDVSVCMKCGEKLLSPAKGSDLPAGQAGPTPKATGGQTPSPIAAVAATPVSTPVADLNSTISTMVEIPIAKLAAGIAVAALVCGGSFLGFRSWKKHHTPKGGTAVAVPAPAPQHAGKYRSTRYVDRNARRPVRHSIKSGAATLPKVRAKTSAAAESSVVEPKPQDATYHVVAEATPLKKRYSSPINSSYAMKRRANQRLWTSQEEQAIRQVQQNRIYGGQRTIERNVDNLMQILRDREYTTAFESGKRLYLYNDLDWSASTKAGPVYEVRLAFSGGREADGSPKKPLHFAFASDLERGTVEPGGEDQVRSNTLHAFFDESRIPPEDRRAIAKDTEELVMAAQPGASPLALDTVVRQFAKVYTKAALSRVADAYELSTVKRKLVHDTRLGSEESLDSVTSVQPASSASPDLLKKSLTPSSQPSRQGSDLPTGQAGPTAAPTRGQTPAPVSKSGQVDFRMERGAGRERTFIARAGTKASASKVWEILTGYDRLKQFMPDMLASEREGQDGAAVIVHMVCLTRFMIFVFKVNLHLRVIEHPREHTLEFEKIAGEFESFRGSVEVTTDPATHDSQIAFHATLIPTGHATNWVMESMARRLLVAQIESIRAKAESN